MQNADTRSTTIGHFRLPDGNILRITHLVVDKPEEHSDDTVIYPREDTIVEIIYTNRSDTGDVFQSEGLRITRRREDYAKNSYAMG